jgi:enoyl-CoA hydratase/carnithine racemase
VSAAAAGPAALGLAEAVDRLRAPDATEAYSPLTGEPLLVVDLGRAGPTPDPAAMDAARETLRRLPAPSVALRAGAGAGAAIEFELGFDLVLDRAGDLEPIRSQVQRTPLACMALVQLLRHSEGLDVETGLFAESLVYSTLQSGPEFAAWRAAQRPGEPAPRNLAPAVLVERAGGHLRLRLNRPERHNAFSAEMRDALCEALRIAVCDASVHQVLLSGEGSSFSSGGDLHEFGTLPDPATAHAIRSTRNAARLLADCAPRLRSEVHGACIGAGVELPAFGAELAAQEGTFFQLPEVGMGLVPGAGGTVSLPRRIGRQRTAWLALSGHRLDVGTAQAWGLVDEILPGRGRVR